MKVCHYWKREKQGDDIARTICHTLTEKLGRILRVVTAQKEILFPQMLHKSIPDLKMSKKFDTTMKIWRNTKRRQGTIDDLNFFLNGMCPMVKGSGVLLDGITKEMCIRAIFSFQPILSFNLLNHNSRLHK